MDNSREVRMFRKSWGLLAFGISVVTAALFYALWLWISGRGGADRSGPALMVVVVVVAGAGAIFAMLTNFSIVVNAAGVSKRGLLSRKFIGWREIERVERDSGISIVGESGRTIRFSPYVFRDTQALYEYIEKRITDAQTQRSG